VGSRGVLRRRTRCHVAPPRSRIGRRRLVPTIRMRPLSGTSILISSSSGISRVQRGRNCNTRTGDVNAVRLGESRRTRAITGPASTCRDQLSFACESSSFERSPSRRSPYRATFAGLFRKRGIGAATLSGRSQCSSTYRPREERSKSQSTTALGSAASLDARAASLAEVSGVRAACS